MALDYKALRAQAKTGRPRRFDPETAAARQKEQADRSANAKVRARAALAAAYPDDWRTLYLAAKAEINAERGPLPGDAA
jgi:hypothetical protein